jgi:hypothetical protein
MDEHDSGQQADAGAPLALPYLSPWKPLRRLSLEGAAVLVCRGLALWAWVQVLQSLTYSVLMSVFAVIESPLSTFRLTGFASQLVLLPQLLIFAVAGAVLWFKANWLSDRMTRIIALDAPSPTPATLDAEATSLLRTPVEDAAPVLGILLTATGVFVLGGAIPELGRAFSAPLFARTTDNSGDWVSSIMGSPDLWPAIIKCAIGTWLMLGSRGVARLVLKLRKTDPKPEPASINSCDAIDGPL